MQNSQADTLKRTQRTFAQSGEKWLKILPLIIPKWADTVKKNDIRVARMVGHEPKKWPILRTPDLTDWERISCQRIWGTDLTDWERISCHKHEGNGFNGLGTD